MQNYPIERKRRRIKKFHFSLRVAVVGCCAFLASISNVNAQEKSTSDTLATTIDEVAITGTRAPLATDKSARIVGVITKEDNSSSRSGSQSRRIWTSGALLPVPEGQFIE